MSGFFRQPAPASLEEFLGWFYGGGGRESYNLEEVLAYLDLTRTRGSIWRTTPDSQPRRFAVANLYDALIAYAKDVLAVPDGPPCDSHVALFQRLRDKDSVLTLNYDVVADRALRHVEAPADGTHWPQSCRTEKLRSLIGELTTWNGTPPSLAPWETEYGFFLKLHGSLDWLACPTSGCRNHANLFTMGLSGALGEGQQEGRPCRYCGAALRILLVPPVATKRLEDRGRLAFLWNLALIQIARAATVVLVGLSFAPSDFELRWLIAYAMQLRHTKRRPPTLHVVNPNGEHRAQAVRAFASGRPKVKEFADLEAFLDQVDSLHSA